MSDYIQAVDLRDFGFPEKRLLQLATDYDPEAEDTPVTVPDSLDDIAGTQQETNINSAIDAAEAEANARLSRRFSVPVSPVGADLKLALVQMAIYHLFERKIESEGGGTNPFEKKYDRALKWLQEIIDGDGPGLGVTPTSGEFGGVKISKGSCGVFVRGGLERF